MKNGKKAGFVKFPRALLTDEAYRSISVEAKILYALMLDRVGVSEISGWKDAGGKTYIYYTMEEAIVERLCSMEKSVRVGGEDIPADVVKERYRMLDRHSVEYVLDGLQQSKTEIRSLKKYLAAALFNAPRENM